MSGRAPPGLTAVVVGGGIAGLAAATGLAERGVRVTVLEREAFLGGRAGSFADRLADGTPFQMERGFHGLFRQYYNLRAMLRRIDPELSFLRPLDDYPLLGPGGLSESFTALPRRTPFNLVELVRRSESIGLSDLRRVALGPALAMLSWDGDRSYARWDAIDARTYLDSLRFPPRARQMLFDVFSHSFFNPEDGLSAAELLMTFHFYFVGNPEGLVFDVVREPFATAIWEPYRRYLERLGVELRLRTAVRSIAPRERGGYRVETDGLAVEADVAVLALDVPGLRRLAGASPDLADLRDAASSVDVTLPFAVWRLFLDRPARPERAPFAGTTGVGLLDNISLYERLEGESRALAARTGGSIVELHAYAVPAHLDETVVRRDLLAGLHALYPETREARILEDRFLLRRDCPAFPPGGWATRPRVTTARRDLCLAGDFVKLDRPSALMERAATSGLTAANELLRPYGVVAAPLATVPPRGVLARFARGAE